MQGRPPMQALAAQKRHRHPPLLLIDSPVDSSSRSTAMSAAISPDASSSAPAAAAASAHWRALLSSALSDGAARGEWATTSLTTSRCLTSCRRRSSETSMNGCLDRGRGAAVAAGRVVASNAAPLQYAAAMPRGAPGHASEVGAASMCGVTAAAAAAAETRSESVSERPKLSGAGRARRPAVHGVAVSHATWRGEAISAACARQLALCASRTPLRRGPCELLGVLPREELGVLPLRERRLQRTLASSASRAERSSRSSASCWRGDLGSVAADSAIVGVMFVV
uniref:Uncharacterized protein n=1 Tax=Emiliania huxleyi TaxID=2903 RepID=A0A7S3WKA5_EMIHU